MTTLQLYSVKDSQDYPILIKLLKSAEAEHSLTSIIGYWGWNNDLTLLVLAKNGRLIEVTNSAIRVYNKSLHDELSITVQALITHVKSYEYPIIFKLYQDGIVHQDMDYYVSRSTVIDNIRMIAPMPK